MAIGDEGDFLVRIRNLLPNGWFPVEGIDLADQSGDTLLDQIGEALDDNSPGPVTLSGFLASCANTDAFVYSLIQYAKAQTRIKTATDGWLDLIAYDFFGLRVQRQAGQSDASFQATIIAEVFRIRNTRAAIIKVLQDLTGHTPLVFGPGRDGGFLNASAYYNAAGAYGSRGIPYQSFVTAYRGNGVSDALIYGAVESVRAEGTILWVQIQNP